MKLTDLIPSSEVMAGFRGIEQRLQSRRYTSRWSLIVAVVSVVAQVAFTYHLPWPPFPNRFSSKEVIPFLTSPAVILFCLAIVATLVWLLGRYTSFLFKQSREPFRYTFCIEDFKAVTSTPGEGSPATRVDPLKLLRNDLTERLDRRVRRFSFLESPNTGGSAQSPKGVSPTSHFQIEGDYAIREENEAWILHVWPRVRIGPESNPFTLAFPVRLPLEVHDEKTEEIVQGSALRVEDYERLVERVYSSVATEIYKQIEVDLQDKMTLFPTGSLQALARYNEAEDFETSNTIDAYDRALEMYRLSLDELKASRWHGWRIRIGQRWPRLVSWEWTGIRAAMESEAKIKLGYSRCLIYRRLASGMAGRVRNPIFETRQKLNDARELLRRCYNSFLSKQELRIPLIQNSQNDSDAEVNAARLSMALASFPGPVRLRPRRKHSYLLTRETFCEAFAVSALGHSLLRDSKTAQSYLQLAAALAISSDAGRVRLLLLLVKAELEPGLRQKVSFLNQAKELNPDSEIVLYRLAYYSDLLARDSNEITPARAEYLSCAYEAVLKVNPANIASLIGQGYLFWLTGKLDKARKKLAAGTELQKIVTQTFVGDLKYCLARVKVEQAAEQLAKPDLPENRLTKATPLLNQAVFDYEEATVADPAVAASYVDTQGRGMNSYYERINQQMLERYQQFASRTRELSTIAAGYRQTKVSCHEQLTKTINTLLSHALNDYGNACLNYYLRFEVYPGEVSIAQSAKLQGALGLLEESVQLHPTNFMAEYNRFSALTWINDDKIYQLAANLTRKGAELSPMALAAVLTRAVQQQSGEIYSLQPEIDTLTSEIEALKKDLDNPTEKEGTKNDLAQKRQSLDQKEQSLLKKRRRKKFLEEQLKEPVKPVMDVLRTKTQLAPFAEYLDPSKIGELLETNDINWSDFGDREIFALAALAQVWALSSDAREASRRLCRHILRFYYPENFDVIRTLLSVTTEPEERRRLNRIVDKAIKWSVGYDPTSHFYKLFRMERCDESVSGDCKDWPYQFSEEGDYEQAIKLYEEATKECADFPSLHYSLAFAYEYRAKQLAGNNGGRDKALENSKLVLQERREACRLDPENEGYRDNLLATQGRQLIAGNTFEDPLEQRAVAKVIEVEFATESIPDLGFTETGLSVELQQRIAKTRTDLKTEAGFILPGINFRDNTSFERGQLRFLIRGVPLPLENLSPKAPQNEQWDELTRRIKEVARNNAAILYTLQDCYFKLREIANAEGMDCSDIQNHSEALFALTWVLKTLLSEQVPISDFASIVAEFRRCRSQGLGLMSTAEEIRSMPQIRKRLPGNSLDPAPVTVDLNQEAEDRIHRAVDRAGSEPILRRSAKIRQEVRLLASKVKMEAGDSCAVLLTSREVRPFVRQIIEGLDVNVLSRREILPALLSRIRDSDAAARTQLRAQAGS